MTFELLNNDLFEQLLFANPAPDDTSTEPNFCTDCNLPMEISGADEYQCTVCGRAQNIFVDSCADHESASASSIKIGTGAHKGRYYNFTGDYSKVQLKAIQSQLSKCRSTYRGNAFSHDILAAVALRYNEIQKLEFHDDSAADAKPKKFVKRGAIKNEIIAALMYYECIRKGVVRKKRDIAEFMGLEHDGFSRGDSILRNLHAMQKIDLPMDEEPIEGFVDRYLETLNIESPVNSSFIISLVDRSENERIGMSSQLSSKVVGALWVLILRTKLPITSQQLEKAADGIKKNTFMKFYKEVYGNISFFTDIFAAHNVPLN